VISTLGAGSLISTAQMFSASFLQETAPKTKTAEKSKYLKNFIIFTSDLRGKNKENFKDSSI